MQEIGFTRRWLVEAGVVAAAAASASATPASAAAGAGPYDPRATSAGQVKLEAYADGRPAPWWYVGTIYAVRERTRPQALFRFEGSETYWAEPRADGSADMHTRTLTFFRDIHTGAWLDAFDNPITGQRNQLRPNLLRGDSFLPADGSPPRPRKVQAASEIAPRGMEATDPDRPGGAFEWIVSGDMVLRMGDRSAPVRLQPSMEAQSTFGDAAAFFDPKVARMSARFSSTTFSPYLAWMGMLDEPGHLIWHASGRKFEAFGALPRGYRDRAEAIMPGVLTSAPG